MLIKNEKELAEKLVEHIKKTLSDPVVRISGRWLDRVSVDSAVDLKMMVSKRRDGFEITNVSYVLSERSPDDMDDVVTTLRKCLEEARYALKHKRHQDLRFSMKIFPKLLELLPDHKEKIEKAIKEINDYYEKKEEERKIAEEEEARQTYLSLKDRFKDEEKA